MAQCTYRAIVLVSLGQDKVAEQLDNEQQRKKLALEVLSPMGVELRNQRGVRLIEGVLFKEWRAVTRARAGATDPTPSVQTVAPWKPAGALLILEARDMGRLNKNIETVWKITNTYDQEMMVLEPLGDVDSM